MRLFPVYLCYVALHMCLYFGMHYCVSGKFMILVYVNCNDNYSNNNNILFQCLLYFPGHFTMKNKIHIGYMCILCIIEPPHTHARVYVHVHTHNNNNKSGEPVDSRAYQVIKVFHYP